MRAAFAIRFAMLSALAAGCSSDDPAETAPFRWDLTPYSTSCSAPTECTLVPVSDPCQCECAFGAVAAGAASKVKDDQRQHQAENCPGPRTCGVCPEPMPTCKNQVCGVP